MFDSLDDKIKHDEALETTPRERAIKRVAIALLSIFLFGGLFVAVRVLE